MRLMEVGAEQAERWERMKKKKNPDQGFSGETDAIPTRFRRDSDAIPMLVVLRLPF